MTKRLGFGVSRFYWSLDIGVWNFSLDMPIPPLMRTQSPRSWRGYQDHTGALAPRRASRAPHLPRRGIKKKLLRAITITALIALPAAAGALFWLTRGLPSPTGIIERPTPVSTKIYDRTGATVLYELYADEKRTPIALNEIPEYLKWATIVREDRNFYNHQGISIRGIVRSAFRYVVNLGPSGGGGSTLTQQFVKNAVLTNEKTFTRKIKEVVLTWRMEHAFTKDKILEMYLNEIPYGGSNYGIEAAAKTYLGKSARDVSLAEAAALAVIPKAPTYYSPYGTHTKELFAAQQYLLGQMAEQGYISNEDAEAAKKEKIAFQPFKDAITAPHFVMYIRELLTERYGEIQVQQGGLKVVTTLDLKLQKIAEEAVTEGVKRNEKDFKATNAAMVAMNATNGEILAMVGSRDYFDTKHDGNFNVVLSPRQPGSSFKPIVYATLLTIGAYSPDTILFDVDTVFKTDIEKDYAPHDYDGKERGPVSIRTALAGSLNTPAVKALYLAGVDTVLTQAEKMGYTTLSDRSRFGLSLVLGGGEVKLLEHTAALSSLGQGGIYHTPIALLSIQDKDGKTIWKAAQDDGREVLPKQVALQVTNIMSDNNARTFMFGAQSKLQLGDRPVAAKTGTTNDFRDAWTVGFTPSLAAGVWVGNNDFTSMKKGADGSVVAAPIWNTFMKRALEKAPIEPFPQPDPVTLPTKPMLNGKVEGDTLIRIDRASGKLATNLTPASFIMEYRTGAVHNILHYVNKSDPLGPVPANPADDPQYKTWEEAVQRWAAANGFTPSTITPPIAYDDVHTETNRPTLTVISPSERTTITGQEVTVAANASAPRGISRIEVSINNQPLATLTSAPYAAVVPLHGFDNGNYDLALTAYDDIDNSRTVTVPITIARNANASAIEWIKPVQGASLQASAFPQAVVLTGKGDATIAKVDLYLRNLATNQTIFLGVANTQGERSSLIWEEAPKAGRYRLSAVLTHANGTVTEGTTIDIEIVP